MDRKQYSSALQNAVAYLKGQKIIKKEIEISTGTGFSKGSVSSYVTGNQVPSKNFISKFEEVYKLNLKDFVKAADASIKPDVVTNNDKVDEDKKLISIYNLAEGNKILSENNKIIAEAHKVLANSNAELVQLIKKFSSGNHLNNQSGVEPISDGVLEVLAEAALQKFRSKEEAFAFLHSKLKGDKHHTSDHN